MKKSLFAIATTIFICLSFSLLAQENPINDITIKIDGLKDGFYLRDELLKMEKLVCNDENYVVYSYSILFSGENGDIYEVRERSSSFSSNVKKVLASDYISGMIWIENIIVGQSDSTFNIQPIFIRLHDMFTGINAKIELDGLRWFFDEVISKEDFLSNDRLKCTDPNLRISSYSIMFSMKGALAEIQSNSDIITEEIKKVATSNSFTGKVWIENVTAVNEQGDIISLKPIAFNID